MTSQNDRFARRLRHLLLSSASAGALLAMGAVPGEAQGVAPGTFVSLEGGAACTFGDEIGFPTGPIPGGNFNLVNNVSDLQTGNDRCGWTGRIGLGVQGQGVAFGIGDYMGLFVRHRDLKENSDEANLLVNARFGAGAYFPNYRGIIESEYDESQTVVDFEIGRDVGIGGASARAIAGVRYARFTSDSLTTSGSLQNAGYVYAVTVDSGSTFDGAGPRLGLSASVPLGEALSVLLSGSGSYLYGRRKAETETIVFSGIPLSMRNSDMFEDGDNTWVFNIEGEAALSLLPFGAGNGQLDIGVRAELWDDIGVDHAMAVGGGNELERHNWGPFARFTTNLTRR